MLFFWSTRKWFAESALYFKRPEDPETGHRRTVVKCRPKSKVKIERQSMGRFYAGMNPVFMKIAAIIMAHRRSYWTIAFKWLESLHDEGGLVSIKCLTVMRIPSIFMSIWAGDDVFRSRQIVREDFNFLNLTVELYWDCKTRL